MNYKEYFETLNREILKAKTTRSIKNLEKSGENYVKNILKNENINITTKKDIKRELINTKKFALKMIKKIK